MIFFVAALCVLIPYGAAVIVFVRTRSSSARPIPARAVARRAGAVLRSRSGEQ